MHARQGSILIIALFIMLAMVGTGITLATIMRGRIVQARNEDNAVRARYAAEAGVERGLDIVMARRLDKSPTAPTSLASTLVFIETLPPVTGSTLNYAFDPVRTTESVQSISVELKEHESAQIDLFNPDDAFVVNPVQSVRVDWVEAPACGGNSQLEFSLTEFSYTGTELNTAVIKDIQAPCSGFAPLSGFDCSFVSNDPAALNNYMLRVKARNCDLPYVVTRAYAIDNPTPTTPEQQIASQVLITTIGSLGQSRVAFEARAPWRFSATGLTDFVLFSESNINK